MKITTRTDSPTNPGDLLTPQYAETLLLASDLIRLYLRTSGPARDDELETLRATLVGWARHRLGPEQVRDILAASYDALRAVGQELPTAPALSATAS